MTTTFGSWLIDQQHRNDPIGDLAKDFSSACKWRNEDPAAKSPDQVSFQMDCLGACDLAYEALDAAATEWRRSR